MEQENKTYETKFEDGTTIDGYTASFAVSFSRDVSDKDQIKAWSYLIGSGEANRVRGWFKLHADNLIAIGLVSAEGVIDWNKVEDFDKNPTKYMKVVKPTKDKVVSKPSVKTEITPKLSIKIMKK